MEEKEYYAPLFTSEEEKRIEMNTIKYLGKKERSIEIAKNMLENNYSKEEISKITKLSIEEINNLI